MISFDNKDSGVPHNFDVYTSNGGTHLFGANGAAETVMRAVPLAGGAVLLLLALRPWRELLPQRAVAQAA